MPYRFCPFSLFHPSKHPFPEGINHVSDFLLLASWCLALTCDPPRALASSVDGLIVKRRIDILFPLYCATFWKFSALLQASLRIPMASYIEVYSLWFSSTRSEWVSLLPCLVKSDSCLEEEALLTVFWDVNYHVKLHE